MTVKKHNINFEEYLTNLNKEIETAIAEAAQIPIHGKKSTDIAFNNIMFVYFKYHEPNKLTRMGYDVNKLQYITIEADVEKISRAYRTQFENVQELFGGYIWILSQSKKHYKYDKYEACLLYEFLARNNVTVK